MKRYKYLIIGGGISGCSIAYEFSKYSQDILLIDKNSDVAMEASGAAGAFLSPLLGKPNGFKELVTQALKYSTKLYQEEFTDCIDNCGTVRIPKDEKDAKKFETYKPYMDFEYTLQEGGCFFPIGSAVNSYQICKKMVENIDTKFNYEVKTIEYKEDKWIVNNEIEAQNVILTTGYDTSLLDEFYIQIRAVWGRRIDIKTTTEVTKNYHKACSISKSFVKEDGSRYLSIGATHHRDKKGVEDIESNHKELLQKANDIINLENVTVVKDYIGARASSTDYFPLVGSLINSKKTLEEFPYLKHGTHVEAKRFSRYQNLFILNGVGGRGFVLAPYLAKLLCEYMYESKKLDKTLEVDRLFLRLVKRIF